MSATVNINLLLDLRTMIPYLITGPFYEKHQERLHSSIKGGGRGGWGGAERWRLWKRGRRSSSGRRGGGDRRGRQAGLTEPGRAGSPGRKSHGRHSPNRPRLGRWRSSLPVWTSTATVLPWAWAPPPPQTPDSLLSSRLLSGRLCLLTRCPRAGSPHQGHLPGPRPPALLHPLRWPCWTRLPGDGRAPPIQINPKTAFTPPDLTCHLHFSLKFRS